MVDISAFASHLLRFSQMPSRERGEFYNSVMEERGEDGQALHPAFKQLLKVAKHRGFPMFWRDRDILSRKFNGAGVTIFKDPAHDGAEYHPGTREKNTNHVILGKGYAPITTLRVLAHELGHVCISTTNAMDPWMEDEGTRLALIKAEVVAETTAMLTLAAIGIDVMPVSAAYIVSVGGVSLIQECRPVIDRVVEEMIEVSGIEVI